MDEPDNNQAVCEMCGEIKACCFRANPGDIETNNDEGYRYICDECYQDLVDEI